MPNFLEGKWKIPGVGEVPKPLVIGGVGVVGYLIYRYRSKQSSSSATGQPGSSSDPYPPDGTTGNPSDLYSTDPATGMTYGDEQYGASGPGSGSGLVTGGDPYPWDGTYNNPSDPFSMDTSTGQTYGDEGNTGGSGGSGAGGGGGGGGSGGGPPFTTNAQWSQYVLQYFSQNSYGNIPGRTNAIGAYIAGREVNAQQQTWINDAIAIAGSPPVRGPGGYPPNIRVNHGHHGGGGGGGKTYATNPVSGLHVTIGTHKAAGAAPHRQPPASADIAWHPSDHAATYRVTVSRAANQNGGGGIVHQADTSSDKMTVPGLTHGTPYVVKVLAQPARPSARPASRDFRG